MKKIFKKSNWTEMILIGFGIGTIIKGIMDADYNQILIGILLVFTGLQNIYTMQLHEKINKLESETNKKFNDIIKNIK